MINLKEILEGPGQPMCKDAIGRIRRQELPGIIRDQVRHSSKGIDHICIVLSHGIAIALAQDLDLAIVKDPSNSYCE